MPKKLQYKSNEIFFSLRQKTIKIYGEGDRVELDQKIRAALRSNEPLKIRECALRHPLRPILISARYVRDILRRQGFIHIPLTRNLYLVPEGTSRREAKRIRDSVFIEAHKNLEERLLEEEKGEEKLEKEETNFDLLDFKGIPYGGVYKAPYGTLKTLKTLKGRDLLQREAGKKILRRNQLWDLLLEELLENPPKPPRIFEDEVKFMPFDSLKDLKQR